MKELFQGILKYIILACVVFLSAVALVNMEYMQFYQRNVFYLYALGIIIYLIVYFAFLKRKLTFYENMIHELTHLLFAIIFFNKITGFHVTEDSGLVQYNGKKNFIILLSPYFFPLIPLLLIFICNYLHGDYQVFGNMIVLMSYTFYLIRLFRDFSFRQTDIIVSGRFYSFVFVACINIIFLIFVTHLICGELSDFFVLFRLENFIKLLAYERW